jgi:alkylglycerol monooxygenase
VSRLQFWVHTTVIRRLGVLEYIFVTPRCGGFSGLLFVFRFHHCFVASHHRVHHDRRVHKNYGGIFIIWDRLFGSFVDEGEDVDPNQPDVPDGDERVVYGILYGVYTWDFFKVQFHHLLDIAHRWTTASGMKDKLKLLWSGPGMRPGMTRTNLAPMNPNVVRLRYVVRSPFHVFVFL